VPGWRDIRLVNLTWPIAIRYHPDMTGQEVKRIRHALGLTQRQFAAQLGVHVVTVAKWETDMQGLRGPAVKLITMLGAAKRLKPGRRAQRSARKTLARKKGKR
jgi:transcriptional regulator with XRE-family HTH domain